MIRVLDLSESCREALAHIKNKLNEGQFEETSSLMSDVVEGFYHLEKALKNLLEQLPINNIEHFMQQLLRFLEQIVIAYEQNNPGQVQEELQFNLQPASQSLHHELESAFRSYTLP